MRRRRNSWRCPYRPRSTSPLARGSEDLGNPNPHMKYVNLIDHGYYVLDVLEDRVQADYFYTPVLVADYRRRILTGGGVARRGGHFLSEQSTRCRGGKDDTGRPGPGRSTRPRHGRTGA